MLHITATSGNPRGAAYWRRSGAILALGLALLFVSACESARDVSRVPATPPSPPPTLDMLWGQVLDDIARAKGSDWITSLGDANLRSLVARAGKHNRDFDAFIERMDAAVELSQRASEGLLPQLRADATATAAAIVNAPGDQRDVAWAIETAWLSGLLMRLKEEARARQRTPPYTILSDNALRADLLQLRHYLVGLIAKAWFIAVGHKLQIRLQREFLQSRREMRKKALERVREGRASLDAVNRIRGAVITIQEVVMRRQDNLDDAMLALGTLLGKPPLAAMDTVKALPSTVPQAPAGLSSRLLERRADIGFADSRVTLSLGREEGRRSTQVPEMPLTAADGGHSALLVATLNGNNPQWSTITAFLLPGQRWRRYINTLLQRRALDAYIETVTKALREVMAVLQNERILRKHRAALDDQLIELAAAERLQKKQYEAGKIDLATFDEAQKTHFALRRELINQQVELLKQRVNLHLAVAGALK